MRRTKGLKQRFVRSMRILLKINPLITINILILQILLHLLFSFMSVKDSQTNRINVCKDAAEEERSSFMYYPSRIGGSRQFHSLHEAHE